MSSHLARTPPLTRHKSKLRYNRNKSLERSEESNVSVDDKNKNSVNSSDRGSSGIY